MSNKVFLYKNGVCVGEGVDVMGTLHVHFYKKKTTFTYKFGHWPRGYKIVFA